MRRRARGVLVAALLGLLAATPAPAVERMVVQFADEASLGLLEELNGAFARDWQARTGQRVRFRLAALPPANQAQALAAGLTPDLASARALPGAPLMVARWATTISFLARTAEGAQVRDWEDLLRPGLRAAAADPCCSEAGRWSWLAAWSWALSAAGGDHAAALGRIRALYGKIELVRGVTAREFLRRGRQDVLLWYESEALDLAEAAGEGAVRTPSLSVRVEPAPLVPTDGGGDPLRQAYLDLLEGPVGQELAAAHHFRTPEGAPGLPELRLSTVEGELGGWQRIEDEHFASGGLVEQVLAR